MSNNTYTSTATPSQRSEAINYQASVWYYGELARCYDIEINQNEAANSYRVKSAVCRAYAKHWEISTELASAKINASILQRAFDIAVGVIAE